MKDAAYALSDWEVQGALRPRFDDHWERLRIQGIKWSGIKNWRQIKGKGNICFHERLREHECGWWEEMPTI